MDAEYGGEANYLYVRSFRKFILQELTKVNIEFGLVVISYNLLKQAEKNHLLQKEDPENEKTRREQILYLIGFYCLIRVFLLIPLLTIMKSFRLQANTRFHVVVFT
ncbi:hypothetical protein BpJC7_15620 [Weizmannia acidilactici]|uniref:Uncharacterized protein n=1 Tax=Weizmannia acidilactici TaxID=2607726 RepID=A0A5J4JFK1_9BACI|nr:hypothetical protein BpJC7_15620 [Weizmannia acidilactici]